MKSDGILFRTLDKEEEKAFRDWARENYTVGDEVNIAWHPVVRAECEKMNAENFVAK